MLSALGVVLLYLGAFVDVLDMSMAVFASFVCVIAAVEYGASAPWMIYGAVSVLSLVLLPNKTPALFFALFFGFYPIIKEKIEKLNALVAWILKEILFNLSLFAIVAVLTFVFGVQDILLSERMMLIITIALCELVFVLYDILLKKIVVFYKLKIRKRLRLK